MWFNDNEGKDIFLHNKQVVYYIYQYYKEKKIKKHTMNSLYFFAYIIAIWYCMLLKAFYESMYL